jgi:putative serine protease PepD
MLVVIALVAALVGGALGGAVAYSVAAQRGTASVLDQPLPGPDAAAAPAGSVEQVADKVLPSVVQVNIQGGAQGGAQSGEGSGLILSGDGLILTNNHVAEPAANGGSLSVVFRDGRKVPAQIVGRAPTFDVAVIKAQGVSGLTPVTLGNSDSLRVGQEVVAIGSPLGLEGSVTNGIVSALDRAVALGQTANDATVINALQTDAAINPGNSGGPLVDMNGRVIGINTAIATAGQGNGSIGVGFAIPINQAKRVADELQRTGQANQAVLGVRPAPAPDGVTVSEVTPGSPAEKAGLKAGDVITKVNDRPVTEPVELVAAIRSHAPGEAVTLTVGGRPVQVTLGSQPATGNR